MNAKQYIKSALPAQLWGFLQKSRFSLSTAAFRKRHVVHSYGGESLKVHIADNLAEGWYDHDWSALPEIETLRRGRLKPGATVFDIGAHQCVVAMMLGRCVGPEGVVVAVEASEHDAQVGRHNIELNLMNNVHVEHVAVGPECGTVDFTFDGCVRRKDSKSARVVVPAITVDALAEKYGTPDVVFIDVEGFECEVLKGAQKVLSTRPDCFVEVHVGVGLEKFGGSVDQLLQFFPDTQYQRFMASTSGGPFVAFEREGAIPERHFNFVALSKVCD
jgi:FkbM family methyltransferase